MHATKIFELLQKHLEVRYVYEQEQQTEASQSLTSKALAALPLKVLESLERAFEQLSPKLICAAIETIRSYNTSLAVVLTRLTKEFKYQEILTSLERAKHVKESKNA